MIQEHSKEHQVVPVLRNSDTPPAVTNKSYGKKTTAIKHTIYPDIQFNDYCCCWFYESYVVFFQEFIIRVREFMPASMPA